MSKWEFGDKEDGGFHGEQGLAIKVQEYFRKQNLPVTEEVGKNLIDLYHALMALEKKIVYVVTGPVSTIALMIKTFPEIQDKIERFVIMGTSIEIGNITDHAEFNAFCDPEALEIMAKCSKEKLIYGLEPLDYCDYDTEFIEKVKAMPFKHAWMIAAMLEQVKQGYIDCG